MYEPAMPSLAEWETFYLLVGSSAAVMTGLMFVVIALGAEGGPGGAAEYRAFGTPNVVHFCGVLLIIALLTMPRQTVRSLGLCMGAVGLAGLGLTGWVVVQVRRQQGYAMVPADWLWHVALPLVCYGALLASAVMLWHATEAALYALGVLSLLLLFIGIHNAWDAAVYIAIERRRS